MAVAERALGPAEARSVGFFSSSVGKKMVMAVTGIVLFGFVTVHMVGNLQVYMGAAALTSTPRSSTTCFTARGSGSSGPSCSRRSSCTAGRP